MSWTNHLVLNNEFEGFSLGKTISITLSISFLSVVLCLGLQSHNNSFFHIVHLLTQPYLVKTCLDNCVGETLCVKSVT